MGLAGGYTVYITQKGSKTSITVDRVIQSRRRKIDYINACINSNMHVSQLESSIFMLRNN